MPRKVFVAGEILTAADVNEFLSEQVVMTFAGTAARGSAIGTAVEGMVTYLEDTDSFEYWDGSAWDELTLPVSTTTPVSGDSLVYDGTNWVNGPRSGNAIINGDFGVWQRGTSFADVEGFTADRWRVDWVGGAPVDSDVTRESFTPADIEAIGYGDAEFFLRALETDTEGSTTSIAFRHLVEDVRTLAGQTVTLSLWAKASTATTLSGELRQNFGSGGSADVSTSAGSFSVTTAWQRFSVSVSLPSVSGKTIGSSSLLEVRLTAPPVDGRSFDLWGVQLEAGPVATPFKLAGGGSKAAELALCQRYYVRYDSTTSANTPLGAGQCASSTTGVCALHLPVEMRIEPSVSTPDETKWALTNSTFGPLALTSLSVSSTRASTKVINLSGNVASGLSTGNATMLTANNNTSAVLEIDAEL